MTETIKFSATLKCNNCNHTQDRTYQALEEKMIVTKGGYSWKYKDACDQCGNKYIHEFGFKKPNL